MKPRDFAANTFRAFTDECRRSQRHESGKHCGTCSHHKHCIKMSCRQSARCLGDIAHHKLANDRPNRQSTKNSDRQITRSFGFAIFGTEFNNQNCRTNKQRGFTNTHQRAQRQNLPRLIHNRESESGHSCHQRTCDHHRASSPSITDPSQQWTKQNCRAAKHNSGCANHGFAATETVLNENRQCRNQNSDTQVISKCGRGN